MADSFEIGTGHVTIETKYDGRTVRRVSTRAGQQAGASFTKAFFGYGQMGRNRRFRKMLDQFFRPLDRMQSLLNKVRRPALFAGIASSILAMIPSITLASSAVGVGMVPAMLSWFSTIGMVRGILGALHKDIKGQTLKALDAAADKFKELAREAAKPGLNAFLQEAIKHTPILNKYIKELGSGISDTGFAFRDLLRRGENIQKIRFALDQTSVATRIWYSLLDEAAEVLITLAAAGAPLFLRFTRQMERVAKTIHAWVLLKYETGEMTKFLHKGYLELEKWGTIGKNLLIGLFNIIHGGVGPSAQFVDKMVKLSEQFRAWSAESKNIEKVRRTLQWLVDHVGDFFRLAAAATAVGLALKGIGAAQGAIMTLRTMLTLGPVAFILFGIGAAVASLAGGMVLAFTNSEKFRKKAGEIWTMIKTRLGPIVKEWGTWIKEKLVPILEDLAIEGLGKLGGKLEELVQTIEDNQEALKELRPVIVWLIGAMSRLTGFVIGALIDELGGLVTALGWIGRAVGGARVAFRNLEQWAGTAVDAVAEWFRLLPERISKFLKGLPKRLADLASGALQAMAFAIGFGLGKVYKFFSEMPGNVSKWIVKTWFTVLSTTTNWFKNIVKFVKDLPDRIINALLSLKPKTKKQTEDAWKGVRTTTGNWLSKIVVFVSQLPDRVWRGLVKLKNRLVDRFAEGWSAATGTSKTKVAAIINFVLAIPGRAWNALRALAGRLADRARTSWTSFQTALGAKVASTIAYVVQIPGRIHRGLGNMASLLKQKGKDVIQGLWDGMTSVWNRVMSWIRGIPAWIRQHKGPLDFDRRLLIPAGKAIMEGLGTGLLFGARSPFSFLKGIAGTIKSLINLDPMALLGDLAGGGGGGSAGGLVGFAKMAWGALSKFGLTMGGWRATGSVPGSDHPKGKAIDIMTGSGIMHRLIIELFKRLPGAKYWISMRKIASAPDWRPRAYSGPSPHTDHVHTSFFRQGGRLPENIWGMGRSGRGYMLHKGEDVIRRNETTIGHQGAVYHYHFQPGSVVLDASSVKDMADVVDLVKNLQSSARQMGVRPRVA